MFRAMRRKNQQLPEDEAVEILEQATSGVLGVAGDNGYPYDVPLSFAYADKKIYFHAATSSHKLDALRRNPKATFCIIAEDNVARPNTLLFSQRNSFRKGTYNRGERPPVKTTGARLTGRQIRSARNDREPRKGNRWCYTRSVRIGDGY